VSMDFNYGSSFVEQQRLVCRGRSLAEAGTVVEVHRDRTQRHAGAGTLGEKLQRDAFLGLYAQDQQVDTRLAGILVEEVQRRRVELDRDLTYSLGEPLSRTHIERYARPSPVIHEESHRGVSVGL